MASASQKRTAAEPVQETRASTRAKTASLKQQEISRYPPFLLQAPEVPREKDQQGEANTLKEVERLKRQLAQQKRQNQKLVEFVHGNTRFCDHRKLLLTFLAPESHGDVDADLSLESEEMDDEPSAMQFSTAVGT